MKSVPIRRNTHTDMPEPIEPEVLPTTVAEVAPIPEGKLERAIGAICQGLNLLEDQASIADSPERKSIEHLRDLLTPSIYQNGKHYKFTFKQQRLMHFLGEVGDFRRACALAGINEDVASRFVRSDKFQEFFKERVEEAAVRRGWTADHFIAELDRVWRGEKSVDREQMDAIKEIGARVAPKIERIQHEFENAEFVFTTRES